MLMQHAYIMEKARLDEFIEALKPFGEIIAPTCNGIETQYLPIEDASELDLSKIPFESPKEYIFPMTETILEVEGDDIKSDVESDRRVLFGVRPCDVAAFQCMTRFFEDYIEGEKIRDSYFMNKMVNTTIVAYNCTEPKEHCFCVAVGTGPAAERGYDIAITSLGDYYLVERGNSRGGEIISEMSLPEASSEHVARKEEAIERCIDAMKVDFNVYEIEGVIDRNIDAVIDRLGDKCIICGGCSFSCPTCTCFNVTDVVDEGVVRRERFWDSCLLGGFTWLAGVGPERDTVASRMKQRIMHKLSYTKEQYGMYSCTGCGRCSRACPSYIFMEDVIRDLLKSV